MGVVSVTDFPPLPGGRRSQVGPFKNVCTVLEIFLKGTESLTRAHLLAVCSALWSVIGMNGVQCFTSSLLSFSSEQLSSKGKKKIVGLILFHLRLSTLERLRMFVMLYWIVGGVLSGGLTGGLGVC